MKTTAALLASLSMASAFTSAPTAPRTTSLEAVSDKMYGSIDLRGQKFEYDPLNFAETYEPLLPWFRECELRHGRTAMLAVVGFIVEDFVRIPGDMYSFDAIPRTIDAHDALLKSGPMYQLLLWIGLWDLIVTAPACAATSNGDREPGDFGWYKWAPSDPEKLAQKKDSEMLNGRLAMIALGGIATQSVITGHGFPYI